MEFARFERLEGVDSSIIVCVWQARALDFLSFIKMETQV